MKESFLNGKSILGVNDEPGILQDIEEALRKAAQDAHSTRRPPFTKPPSCSLPIPIVTVINNLT